LESGSTGGSGTTLARQAAAGASTPWPFAIREQVQHPRTRHQRGKPLEAVALVGADAHMRLRREAGKRRAELAAAGLAVNSREPVG